MEGLEASTPRTSENVHFCGQSLYTPLALETQWGPFASKRTRAARVDDLFLDRLARSRGRAIVTAARASEVSLELPDLGHGLFTHYLLQGLRGAADLDRNGVVELQELYTYLEQQVAQKSRGIGGNQHPVMKGEVEGLLPLVKVGGQ